jgi:type IV pilus assembly protein PilC
MVAAGEKGGLLAEILSRLAVYLENAARLRKKVKSAMMYPTVVSVVAILITIFLLIKVVPVFGEIFQSFGAALPAPTQFLIDVSHFVQKFILLILIGGGGEMAGFTLSKPRQAAVWDTYRIKLPVFGSIAHKICLARFTGPGVPGPQRCSHSGSAADCVANGRQCRHGKSHPSSAVDIERGDGIAAALPKHPIFPTMIIRMMTAGEQTGKIDNMLERIADFLDDEIETTLSGLTALIEPILIVFLGVVVGGMVICMFLPIFKMPEIVSGNK